MEVSVKQCDASALIPQFKKYYKLMNARVRRRSCRELEKNNDCSSGGSAVTVLGKKMSPEPSFPFFRMLHTHRTYKEMGAQLLGTVNRKTENRSEKRQREIGREKNRDG